MLIRMTIKTWGLLLSASDLLLQNFHRIVLTECIPLFFSPIESDLGEALCSFHDLFRLQVDREFVEDSFNLYGLRALVPHYNEALDMIIDVERMDEATSEERQVK
jgi:hypothetical protein